MEDPFFVVKEEVQKSLQIVEELHSNWRRLLHETSTAGNDEFEWTTDELKKNMKNIEWDLQDLEETISIVRSNPEKFKIDRKEISLRERFISDSKAKVQRVNEDLNSPETRGKIDRDQRESLMSRKKGDRSSRINEAKVQENQEFIDQNNPMLLIKRQDEELDQVGNTVLRLKDIAVTIGDELTEQERLLEDLDNRVDNTQGKLKGALRKVEKVYKDSKEKGSLITIVILVIIIIILAVIALTI